LTRSFILSIIREMTESTPHGQRRKAEARVRKSEPGPRRLPPLNAVRAFEAAARHESFALAGQELGVSAGAVSRQIGLLEAAIGGLLFHRDAHGVRLSDQGRRIMPLAGRALDLLAQMLPQPASTSPLRVDVGASFYLRWLMPRVATSEAAPSFPIAYSVLSHSGASSAPFDLAIRYHRFNRPSLEGELLFEDRSILVCSPRLVARRKLPLHIADLKHLPLLHNTADSWDWQAWAAHFKIEGLPIARGQRFDIDEAAIQAALAGQGIALAEHRLVADLLRDGSLIAPFDLPVLSLGQYRLHAAPGAMRRPVAKKFREWLLKEVAASARDLTLAKGRQ
jgi:LysR family glycine cleavage system transcriptional activator